MMQTPAGEETHAERHKNRLAGEKSPYLLQHAENPVDWYPWGDEAFDAARRLDRPVFLSIGYSTCHWCHVMAHESFEDPVVAKALNDTFVSIKVDREERPDIDQQYMTIAQMLTGRGGWPLTLMLAPDGMPFFAATYIPRESRYGMPGMLDLIPKVRDLWKSERSKLLSIAVEVARSFVPAAETPPPGDLGEDILDAAVLQLSAEFDRRYGGFGYAPKFPVSHYLLFLMRHYVRSGDPDQLRMVEETLSAMRQGGIFDQLGGGFHRYSTDQEWRLPHFEKMLYDQAMLVLAYAEAYQLTARTEYRTVAEECLEYVLRNLHDSSGGFYSAEDADSEGVEGKFYLWNEKEVRLILAPIDAKVAILSFGITTEGNVVDHPGMHAGANVLYEARTPAQIAARLGIPEDEAKERLLRAKAVLYADRERRIHPHIDDKSLTDWNGLAIAAFARSGAAFGSVRYQEAARHAANFVLEHMKRPDGGLLHRYREGDAAIEGLLDDYAFAVFGLLELYAMDFDPRWLSEAIDLHRTMLDRFLDHDRGGFYFAPVGGDPRIARRKEIYDGAIPSGNAVAMANGLRLARLTGDTTLESEVVRSGRAFSAEVQASPTAHLYLLTVLDFMLGPTSEVVVAGEPGEPETRTMLDLLHRRFLPRTVALYVSPNTADSVSVLAPFTAAMKPPEKGAAAYVCKGQTCQSPLRSAEALEKALTDVRTYQGSESDQS